MYGNYLVPDYRLDPPDPPYPVPARHCDGCGQPIYEGDDYYATPNGSVWCETCAALKTA